MTAPPVPDDAYDAAVERFVDARAASGVPADVLAVWAGAVRDAVDAAAPLIVAHELRRLADDVHTPAYGMVTEVRDLLRARAAELEAGGAS